MTLEMSFPLDVGASPQSTSTPALRMEVAPRTFGVTVWLTGELDLASRDELRDLIEPIAADGRHVVLDLRGLTFLDSSGINLFVGMHRQCQARGGTFALEAPSPVTLGVLRLSGVDALLTIA